MIVIFAFKTKTFPAHAFDCGNCIIIALDAIVAFHTGTTLIISARCGEELTYLFLVSVEYF